MTSFRFLEGTWTNSEGKETLHFEKGDSFDHFNVTHNRTFKNEKVKENVLICVSRQVEKGAIFNFAGRGKFPKSNLRIVDENNIVLWNQNYTRLLPAHFSFD